MSIVVALKGMDNGPVVERLRAQLPAHHVVALEEVGDDRSGVRYVVAWGIPAEELRTFPDLKAIFSLGAGVDHLMRQAGLPDVPIVRFVDPDLTHRMTEYVVLHVLLHHRHVLDHMALQQRKVWDDSIDQPAGREVRVGILGLGTLGQDAARALRMLRFDVAGWSRTRKEMDGVTSFCGDGEMDAFLARTDILVNLLPLTEATRGLINEGLLAKLARDGMLPGPVLINAGRGGSQVEADILAALDSGTLWAASLDVFETEPLPADSSLWSHPRVMVTPHVAAVSHRDALSAYVAEQITAFEGGATLRNVVSIDQGY